MSLGIYNPNAIFIVLCPPPAREDDKHNLQGSFMFLIIPDMPLVSSLALQAYDLFLSVVKLGKSPRLGWRAMSHESQLFPLSPNSPVGSNS